MSDTAEKTTDAAHGHRSGLKAYSPSSRTVLIVDLAQPMLLTKWVMRDIVMVRRAIAAAFIVCMLVWSLGQEARAAGAKAAALQPTLEVLDKAKLSGSLEFSGHCDLRDFP